MHPLDPRRVSATTWKAIGKVTLHVVATTILLFLVLLVGIGIASASEGDSTAVTVEDLGNATYFAALIFIVMTVFRLAFFRRSPFGYVGTRSDVSVRPVGVARLRQPGDPVPPDLRNRALHEAGHAVAIVVLGHTLVKATIESDYERGSGGYVHSLLKGQRAGDPRPPIMDDIVLTLAGSFAQDIPQDTRVGGVGDDYMVATRVALMHSMEYPESGTIGDILHDATQRSRDLVEKHREDIERVAEGLLEHVTLSGDEVKEILDTRP